MGNLISRASKIVIAGVVSPAGLGDALQYYVANRLLHDLLPEAEITLMCPDLREKISVFGDLKLNADLSSLSLTGGGFLRHLLHSLLIDGFIDEKYTSTLDEKTTGEANVHTINTILKNIRLLARKSSDSYLFAKYLSSPITSSLFSFNGGIFGGHTISSNPYHYIVQYETLSSVVRGPVVTSPISISGLGLALQDCRDRTLLKRLKQALRKLDFIYVRGPNSLEMLRDHLEVSEGRVAMALDSGFGIRRIDPIITSADGLGKQELKIVIVPRKDYYCIYGRLNLYRSYLRALTGLILWLSRSFDAEVYLASQTVGHGPMSDGSAIRDVVTLLERRAGSNRESLKWLNVVKPSNIIDAYRLYSSADFMITSRMHGGIMALSAGVPAVFVIPSADVKLRDVLSFLGLDTTSLMVDMFDVKVLTAENFINKIKNVLGNLEYHAKIVQFAVTRALPTVDLPFKKLLKLLK